MKTKESGINEELEQIWLNLDQENHKSLVDGELSTVRGMEWNSPEGKWKKKELKQIQLRSG
jgi:hypothetical protein